MYHLERIEINIQNITLNNSAYSPRGSSKSDSDLYCILAWIKKLKTEGKQKYLKD